MIQRLHAFDLKKGGTMKTILLTLALFGLVLGGCSKGEEHGDGHEHGGGGNVDVPKHYGEAVERCEELSKKIDDLIAKGELEDVHAVAADIKKIAEKLPELAQVDLPAGALREVNIKAKKLAGMFSEIDEAADAGKKDETIRVHSEMKALIAELKEHVEKEIHHDHEEH